MGTGIVNMVFGAHTDYILKVGDPKSGGYCYQARTRSPSEQDFMSKRWTPLAVVRRRDFPIFGTIPGDIFLVPKNDNPSLCTLALGSVSKSVVMRRHKHPYNS